MKQSFFIFLALIGCTIFDVVITAKSAAKRYDHYDQQRHISQSVHSNSGVPSSYIQESEPVIISHSHHHDEEKGYSIGSGLRSIAQGSADQASNAVVNQHAAAIQAAYVAKSTLAQSAVQAASTALAALAGKEVLLHSLEHQREDAVKSLESELSFLQLAKRAAIAAKQTAQQAQNQASSLAATLNNAQTLVEYAENSAKESAAELAKQTEMVGKSKSRLESIERKLKSVKIDFDATKEAAEKATNSATEAQSNANAAGQSATIGLNNNANNNNHGYQSAGGIIAHDITGPGYQSELNGDHWK